MQNLAALTWYSNTQTVKGDYFPNKKSWPKRNCESPVQIYLSRHSCSYTPANHCRKCWEGPLRPSSAIKLLSKVYMLLNLLFFLWIAHITSRLLRISFSSSKSFFSFSSSLLIIYKVTESKVRGGGSTGLVSVSQEGFTQVWCSILQTKHIQLQTHSCPGVPICCTRSFQQLHPWLWVRIFSGLFQKHSYSYSVWRDEFKLTWQLLHVEEKLFRAENS